VRVRMVVPMRRIVRMIAAPVDVRHKPDG
jgi:hypothetical protein